MQLEFSEKSWVYFSFNFTQTADASQVTDFQAIWPKIDWPILKNIG